MNDGYVRKRGPNTWQVTVYTTEKLPNSSRYKRISKTLKGTKRDAKHLLREMISQRHMVSGKESLETFIHNWFEDWAPMTVRQSTLVRYRYIAESHLIPALGHIRLDKLLPEDIQSYYKGKLENGRINGRGGLSARSVVHHHRLLGRILRQAYKLRKLPHNLMDYIDPPRAEKFQIRTLDLTETEDLITTSMGTRYYPFVVLACDTGMRRSELLGLQWGDVDLDRNTIAVRRTLHKLPGGQFVLQPPKSDSSRRRIDLSADTTEILKRQKSAVKELIGKVDHETYVFLDPDGSPWSPGGVTHGIKKLLRKIGRPDMNLHGLRHSVATNLLRLGIHQKIVQDLLGHADFGTTMNIYTHVSPGLQVEAINKLVEERKKIAKEKAISSQRPTPNQRQTELGKPKSLAV